MTLRTKESDFPEDFKVFSEKLFSQLSSPPKAFLLTPDAPLFTLLHPALIKTQIQFDQGLELKPSPITIQGWNIKCYANEASAKSHHPSTKHFRAHPWIIHQHVLSKSEDVLLDFGLLGWTFLTRQALEHTPKTRSLYEFQQPLWLDYALSTELWGPSGKWTRFHDRLHTLFEKYGLLIAQDFPGFYPLKTQAQKIESAGFIGQKSENAYLLTLPWDFPLSALTELENVVLRELSCSS